MGNAYVRWMSFAYRNIIYINKPVLLDEIVKQISIIFDWSSVCHVCNKHLPIKTKTIIMVRYKILIVPAKSKPPGGFDITPCVQRSDVILKKLCAHCQRVYLRNGKRAACTYRFMDASGRLLSMKEA